jgi:hypothetical protein
VTSDTPRPLGLRGGLRRLSTFLIAYGVIGLLVAVVGLVGLVGISGRIGTAAERGSATIAELTVAMDRTATALADAGATAGSFATTIETSSSALSQAAATIRNVEPQLRDLETQFRSINILGAQPLSRAADLMGQIATDIAGLDQRIDGIASALLDNQAALLKNADSLGALGESMSALSARIKTGIIQESLADQQAVVTVLILVLVMWTAVPAIGALGFGWWLRAELRRGDAESESAVAA